MRVEIRTTNYNAWLMLSDLGRAWTAGDVNWLREIVAFWTYNRPCAVVVEG